MCNSVHLSIAPPPGASQANTKFDGRTQFRTSAHASCRDRIGMFVNRQRVLDRIRKRGTAITALLAPAGYGKSYIAHRIARLEPSWAEVSAAPQPEGRFAERVATALGIDLDASADPGDAIARAWLQLPAPLTLIVENVECLEGDAGGLKILTDLISCHAPDGKIILCARREPGIA